MKTPHGTASILRIHLPEWRDSLAVNQEVRRALRAGQTKILLTGARGDRLLLNDLAGPYEGEIRIDGDVGTELARDLDVEGIQIFVNGSVGSGAGMGMRAGTLVIAGPAGALLGSHLRGGEIWAFGPVGSRAGHRSTGGLIRADHAPGPLLLDRALGGQFLIVPSDDPAALDVQHRAENVAAWPDSDT